MKHALREHIWETMTREGLGAFPFPLKGRIPNFKGATLAAERLFDSEVWRQARVIKSNPDAPQRAVRKRALEEGKTLYMAVPRLRERACFVKISVPPDLAAKAATIKGAFQYGQTIHPREMAPVDLVVQGSVAVNTHGERVGKGGGYADLELAIGFAFDLYGEHTRFVTTVHDCQVGEDDLPQDAHDGLLDMIFTPTRTLPCSPRRARPRAIFWEALSPHKRAEIPILEDLRKH